MRGSTTAVIVAVAFAAAAFSAAGPAEARSIRSFKINNWDGGVYVYDDSNKFSHCAASAKYKSGITLYFSVNNKIEWAMAFSNPSWKLTKGNTYPVSYKVDSGQIHSGTGRALNPQLVQIPLPDTVSRFNEFRYGGLLAVAAGGEVVKFSLTDTSRMLSRLLECAKEYRSARAPGGSGERLFSEGASGAPTPPAERGESARGDGGSASASASGGGGDSPTADSRVEATTVATNVLATAGVANFRFMAPSETPASFKGHDAVWKADNMVGTMRVLAGSRARSLDAIRSGLIASDATNCKGKFASGSLPIEDKAGAVSIFTACEGEKGWSTYYVALPRRAGGHYLISLLGPADARDALQSASGAYRRAALQVMGN